MPSKLARLAELRHTLEPHIAMDLVKRTMRGFLSKHLGKLMVCYSSIKDQRMIIFFSLTLATTLSNLYVL